MASDTPPRPVPPPAPPPKMDGRCGLIIRPGDVLVVRLEHHISDHAAEALKAKYRDKFPGLKDVVVVQADGLAVYREEES